MIDFAALPPEINSGRMYAGAGASPLLAAASSWGNLATELAQAAADHSSTVTGLAAVWTGPSATAMSSSAARYAAWLTTTAGQAAQTAAQAQAAVDAYEVAYAATVAPPLIAANRAQLAALVATNILGQNTAAIMATEALYAEMWAQDVAAMSGYAAESQAATSALPQFAPAPQTTTGSTPAAVTQAATTATTNPLLQFLQTLIPGFTLGQPLQNLADLLNSSFGSSLIEEGFVGLDPVSGIAAFLALTSLGESAQAINIATGAAALPVPPAIVAPAVPAVAGAAPVTAITNSGNVIGRLSVPPGWTQARGPSTNVTLGPARPITESHGFPMPMPLPIPRGGTPNKQNRPEPDYGSRSTVMPQHPYGG